MRAILLEKLYEWSLIPHQTLKKNTAWELTIADLQEFPHKSLGEQLGTFLAKNNFNLQNKLESHDVFHVLTNTGITVPEEISMQFYLLGNGKRSTYLFTVICIGGLLYPDYFKLFYAQYKKGKVSHSFHQLNFYKLLNQPLEKIKSAFSIQ
ncbi:hypothetical protein GH721_16795 [Kriegella sp. EG-1]|nr:hypothetical protein [Flavobacteriaceae bacterium EG-1]